MDIKTILNEEIEDELNELADKDLGSEEYKSSVDGITKLIDRKIEIERLEREFNEREQARVQEHELNVKQATDERIDRYVKNGITVATIVTSTLLTVWGTYKTFKFEEEGSITTSMGRGFINRLFPKK